MIISLSISIFIFFVLLYLLIKYFWYEEHQSIVPLTITVTADEVIKHMNEEYEEYEQVELHSIGNQHPTYLYINRPTQFLPDKKEGY